MSWHATTHLSSSLLIHSFTFTVFQAREHYPVLQQWATQFNLSDRYIFEYGKRGDPTLHFRQHQVKHLLTKEEAKTRISIVEQLMQLSVEELRCIVYIDEATVQWEVDPPHYIAGANTPDFIWPDVPAAMNSAWRPSLSYILAVNYYMGLVYAAPVGHDYDHGTPYVSSERSRLFQTLLQDGILEHSAIAMAIQYACFYTFHLCYANRFLQVAGPTCCIFIMQAEELPTVLHCLCVFFPISFPLI
jgi:hypothetical protein